MPVIDQETVSRATQKLPTLPQATIRALQIMQDPNYSVPALAQVVGLDQALVARVLQWANSPFYGLRRQVSRLEQAIMLLGSATVRELLLTASIGAMLDRHVSGYGLQRGDLWVHSVAVAAGARWLAETRRHPHPDQAFIAGLLHDIGKLVLDVLLQAETTWLGEWAERQAQGASFVDLERWLTGLDHAQLGGQIAEQWELPAPLVEAITFHHDPARATIAPDITRWVHLADAAALMLGIGIGFDGLSYQLDQEAFVAAGLQQADFEALLQAEEEALQDARAMLQPAAP
jgi:HD-like signal output (HDOD) protein